MVNYKILEMTKRVISKSSILRSNINRYPGNQLVDEVTNPRHKMLSVLTYNVILFVP